ncbi:ferrous iron transport protein B [Eubacteriales bacterium OttesenSCG-928-A19]|nr:ferrous iron transport protein B [Eubacteriales bacterium OttesenSCG-928-A19]
MTTKIALAGNPNSGKTTMFNALTGSSQYVGNWPGVTVEKKEGKLRKAQDVLIQDLPGIYSLSPYTLEEVVARNYLVHDQPDAILDIVDATNIERNLYLTTQLLELGIPVVVALNMMDVVSKSGDKIDANKVSAALGCPVVETSALKEKGVFEAANMAVQAAQAGKPFVSVHRFSPVVEGAIAQIEAKLEGKVPEKARRFYAIKLFERDEKILEEIKIDGLEAIIEPVEAELDDDSESIITNERYVFIANMMKNAVKKTKREMTTSDRIDLVVTNRFLAIPIFVVIMFVVYYLSVSTVGAWMTDWVNDVLFGEFVPETVAGWLESAGAAPWLQSLLLDGIIAGVGAVLGFLPQMMVLFLLLAILEDCGYMARIAFILDRVFRKFGLSGKSFIPMMIGTGCSVPGIMASRTIESDRDRRMTIITTSFMPCSAKLPIIALIAGALFGGAWWVGPSAYFVGILAIVCSGIILKKTKLFSGDPAPFVMELPAYHVPSFKGVIIHMWERAKQFVKKAGTIIFVSAVIIWALSTFSFRFEMVEDASESMLAAIGRVIAPIFSPLGWGDWKSAVATITGLIAKENVVGTFGILYGFAEVAEDGVEIWGALRAAMLPLAAYSFLIFNLLCAPCFAAIGAIRREMGNARWTWIAIGYQTILAYCASLVVYQLGMLFGAGQFGVWTVIAFVVLAVFIWLLVRPMRDKGRNVLSPQH